MSFQFLACPFTCVFFLHKSQYVSTSKLCVSIEVHFIFGPSFCVSKVEYLQKLCRTHTLLPSKTENFSIMCIEVATLVGDMACWQSGQTLGLKAHWIKLLFQPMTFDNLLSRRLSKPSLPFQKTPSTTSKGYLIITICVLEVG